MAEKRKSNVNRSSSLSQPSFAVPARNHPPHLPPPPPVSNPHDSATTHDERAQDHPQPQPQQIQSPVRWVYNDDYTDPVNFGFMFPVPANPPLHTDSPHSRVESSHSTPRIDGSTAAGISPAASGSWTASIGGKPAVLPVRAASETSSGGIPQWPLVSDGSEHGNQPWMTSQQPNPPSTHHQDRNDIERSIPYHHIPPPGLSFVPSPSHQRSPLDERAWPPQAASAPQAQGHVFPDWGFDSWGNDASRSFIGPVASGPILTPDFAATAPPPLKRKRESDISSNVATPYDNAVASLDQDPKGRGLSYKDSHHKSSLCSRCQIYEMISPVPGLCAPCLHISFNIWPSAHGTRNENLESLVLFLMPSNMEDVLVLVPPNMPRGRSWRMLPQQHDAREYDFSRLVFHDRWTLSKQQAKSTGLFGDDYAELANIAQLYQLSLPRPNKSLEASCTVLITICELYKSFVAVSTNPNLAPQTMSIPRLLNNIRTARITLRHAFQQLQVLAVSPSDSRDRQDWFPAFLSSCIMAIAAVIFLDILVACPTPYKEQIWGTAWHDRIVEMRNGGYGMLVGLMKANSKGVNPLKMDCWTTGAPSNPFINVTPDSFSPDGVSHAQQNKRRKRTSRADPHGGRLMSVESAAERDRNVLLGINSPAALQGVLALKAWYLKHSDELKQGEDMFLKSLYRLATMKPVAALWRIFELE